MTEPLTPELERFATTLLAEQSARISLSRCQEIFRVTVLPQHGVDPRQALAEALCVLEAHGRLRRPAPRTKHLWERDRAPPLPIYVSRPRSATEPAPTSVALHPVLARATDLAVGARRPDGLLAADAWLKVHASSAEEVPLAERSFEVFGDEKRLDEFLRTRFAKRGRLGPGTFRAYVVTEPFAMTACDPASRWAVAAENLATYDSLRRVFGNTDGPRPAAVVFGRGNQFVTSCVSMPDRLPTVRRLLYFGDLDQAGLEIMRDVQSALAPRVHVTPWIEAYARALEARPSEGATAPVEREAAEEAASPLPEPLRRGAVALLLRGARIPQESVSLPRLRQLAATVADPGQAAWVHATELRSHIAQDPLLDWLELFGEAYGYARDSSGSAHELRRFLAEKGQRFAAAVVELLRRGLEVERDPGPGLLETLRRGVAVVVGPTLSDGTTRTRATPTLLVRSDSLRDLFPDALTAEEAAQPSSTLGTPWHYRVVEVRYTTLELTSAFDLDLRGSNRATAAGLFVANRALGELQGFTPEASFLLGRSWRRRKTESSDARATLSGDSALGRLGRVRQDAALPDGASLLSVVEDAAAWRRALVLHGAEWSPLPEPTREELRPNMRNDRDAPWRSSKLRIAETLEDLTLIAHIGPGQRARAHADGVMCLSDRRLSAGLLGLSGATAAQIDAVLTAQRAAVRGIWPQRVTIFEELWRPTPSLEFFVDVETVSDLDDDLARFPVRGGCSMTYLIGCGHVEAGAWRYAAFVADALTPLAELRIVEAWLRHMHEVRARLGHEGNAPLVHHWSAAEPTALTRVVEVVQASQATHERTEPRWFDLLGVFLAQPVGVQGAFSHGLKEVARALGARGLISIDCDSWDTDGVGAMIAAWTADRRRREEGGTLRGSREVRYVERYNEADCRALLEILKLLRL